MKKIELEFLRESNHIEGEFSDDALADAKKAWLYLKRQKFLTNDVIKNVHAILMRNRGLKQYEIGEYRIISVYISGKTALKPSLVPQAITSWIYGQNSKDWKKWHIEYEKIHPFVDGNGRTGRMFMNWHRLKFGLPILVIKNAEKQSYYKWFSEI